MTNKEARQAHKNKTKVKFKNSGLRGLIIGEKTGSVTGKAIFKVNTTDDPLDTTRYIPVYADKLELA